MRDMLVESTVRQHRYHYMVLNIWAFAKGKFRVCRPRLAEALSRLCGCLSCLARHSA